MSGVLRSSVLIALCLAAVSCEEAQQRPIGPTVIHGEDAAVDAGDQSCIDKDGDGYGRNCALGKDCDDDNARVTDQCRRCATVNKDCPCKPGTGAMKCVPPTIRVDGGVLVCAEGTRYCRDGYWGDCETIGQYVLQKD